MSVFPIISCQFRDGVPMSAVLGQSLFFKYLPSLRHYDIAFVDQLRNCHGDIFNCGVPLFPLVLSGVGPVNICGSDGFVSVCNCLSWVGADSLSVYTDGLVKNLGMTGCRARAAAFFEDIDLVLALECVPVDCSVHLFLDSQAALDACKSEVDLVCPDFHNQCWVEHQHIRNIIHEKNLKVSWHKVKDHSGVLGNDCADSIANTAALSDCSGFLAGDLHSDVDWLASSRVWHPDLHMATGFTSRCTANIRTYFMKALHCRLPVAVRKRVYDKYYPSVLCLYCGKVEVSNHVFSCVINDAARRQVLEFCMSSWKVLFGLSLSASCVL
ncbi:hypothetical protein G9A89_019251 [Geosiphon pyriformis]|nr:hypothetical protein G9A89_019251 [Geosiphon pyriformis]